MTTSPSETLSSSTDFPGTPVIRLPCSADFAAGRGGFLQLLSMTLPPCCPYQPRRSVSPHQSLRRSMLPSPKNGRLGLRVLSFRGHMGLLALRPGDSLAILVDGFVNGLQNVQFPSFLPFKLRGLDSYPGGTFTHCSCQPSLDAHLALPIRPLP